MDRLFPNREAPAPEGVEEEPTGAAQPVEETGDAFTGGAATGGAGSRKAKRGTF